MCSTRCLGVILSLMGLGVSGLAYYIEIMKEKDPEYKPFCDIDEHVSCTKAFMSEYGKGLGFIGKLVGGENYKSFANS